MLGIVPYIIAAAVKFRHFLICERKLHNLLRAACADNSRNADKYIVFAIFSAKLTAYGHNLFFIVQNNTDNSCRCCCNSVFGALFTGIGYPAAADRFLFKRFAVKAETAVALGELIERAAAEAHA